MSRAARDPRHLISPLLAGFAAFTLYARTLPPGLTWAHNGADGGDLLAAALTVGIPHPTGYPTYQLLLRLAIALAGGEPARAGAWLSALAGACAVALLADLAQRVLWHGETSGRLAGSAAAFIAALAWATSPALWGQSTIVEVYALNALACVASLWLAWRWSEAVASGTRTWAWLLAGGLVLGLGLGNHLTLVLVLPGIGFWYWSQSRQYAHKHRELPWAAAGLLVGLLVYLYLPLAAAGNPPVNWGDPATLNRLLWVVSGRLYAGLAFGLPATELASRLFGWATWTVGQLLPWGTVLALVGLWRLDRRLHAWWIATLLVWLTFTAYAIGYNTSDSLTYLIPAYAVMSLWLSEGLHVVFGFLARRSSLLRGRAVIGLATLALLALPAASIVMHWRDQDLSRDAEARNFLASALAEAEPGAVIVSVGDERTFALWYGIYGLRLRPDVALLNVNLYGYEWYRRSLAARHTSLLPSSGEVPPIEALIQALSAERPVYAAENLGLNLAAGTERPVGVLVRLLPGPD